MAMMRRATGAPRDHDLSADEDLDGFMPFRRPVISLSTAALLSTRVRRPVETVGPGQPEF